MKKTKFLALVLVVAMMMVGAGYAIWSDQVLLNTTVNTGNFAMNITKLTTRTGDNQTQNEVHDWHSYDWTHAGAKSFTSNEAFVVFNELYPGGMVQVDMTMENKGTIPAKLASVDVEYVSGNKDLFELLQAQTSWKADINGDGIQDAWAHVEWNKAPWYNVEEALDALVANTTAKNLVIEPKGWFALGDGTEDGCIKFKLDPIAGNEFQNETCQFKITFNWEQWASNPNDNPYDGPTGYGGDGHLQ